MGNLDSLLVLVYDISIPWMHIKIGPPQQPFSNHYAEIMVINKRKELNLVMNVYSPGKKSDEFGVKITIF